MILRLLQHQSVRNKRDKFRIGGLSLGAVDGVAEVRRNGMQVILLYSFALREFTVYCPVGWPNCLTFIGFLV